MSGGSGRPPRTRPTAEKGRVPNGKRAEWGNHCAACGLMSSAREGKGERSLSGIGRRCLGSRAPPSRSRTGRSRCLCHCLRGRDQRPGRSGVGMEVSPPPPAPAFITGESGRPQNSRPGPEPDTCGCTYLGKASQQVASR